MPFWNSNTCWRLHVGAVVRPVPTWLRLEMLFLDFHKLGGCKLWKTEERGRLARWDRGLVFPHAPDMLPPADKLSSYNRKKKLFSENHCFLFYFIELRLFPLNKQTKKAFTFFPELDIAVITHFSHSVFEVLQRVSVPGAGSAHHLLREIKCIYVKSLRLLIHSDPWHQ